MKIKERKITRTIKVNNCQIMAVNMNDHTVYFDGVKIAGGYTEQELAYLISQNYNNLDRIFVKIESITVDEVLYEMTEQDFIKNGKVSKEKAE